MQRLVREIPGPVRRPFATRADAVFMARWWRRRFGAGVRVLHVAELVGSWGEWCVEVTAAEVSNGA